MKSKITVGISYSWESETHNKKVIQFVDQLKKNNIDVLFDRDLQLGQRVTDFMEMMIDTSDYVLVICTPKYKEKADFGIGGVKYEKNIITAELYANGNDEKFIPILFSGTWDKSLPIWAGGKVGIDYTNKSNKEFKKLLDNFYKGKTYTSKKKINPQKAYHFISLMYSMFNYYLYYI